MAIRVPAARTAAVLTVLGALIVAIAGVSRAQETTALLPNGWHISQPSGIVKTVGTLPQGIALSPNGAKVAFVESGVGEPALHVVDAATFADAGRLVLAGASGRPLWDADGSGLWVGTGAKNSIVHIALSNDRQLSVDRTLPLPGKQFWAYAIARDLRSRRLAISGLSTGSVTITDPSGRGVQRVVSVGRHPSLLAWNEAGTRLYVALWGERSIAVVDPNRGMLLRDIRVGFHPEALLPTLDGKRLYVANADDDTITTIDARVGRVTSTYRLNLFDTRFDGLSPTALALSRDERRLYVVCAAANAVAVVDVTNGMRLLGALPTGWYPTDVAADDVHRRLLVIDGKGEGSHANPNYHPFEKASPPPFDRITTETAAYIGTNLVGSVRAIALPSNAELRDATATVRANAASSPPPQVDAEVEGRRTLAKGGPLHHVFFIIKENRTYDQILGDLPGGDGDPALAVFGHDVTPNEHALATRFGLFDRAFTSEVSQDGHVWLATAFANDYLEKTWPPQYGGRFVEDDPDDPYTTHGGTLWDSAARARLSYRSYGENCDPDPKHKGLYAADFPGLVGHVDPRYPSFDVTIKDGTRVAEWQREFNEYEANGALPSLTWLWLPSDHTAGTRVGMRTPRAMVAENDLAVGTVIATISHSRYWADTAIFIIEDDAQDGPDHVDEQRTTLYVVSPYALAGTHHEQYTANSVVRTIELILGLPPMSTYDAGARPLYAAFGSTPDLRPYAAIAAKVELDETNTKAAYRASDSNAMDFSKADMAPAAALDDIIQRQVVQAR